MGRYIIMNREIKFRMFVKGIGMFYRGIYDKNWYKNPKKVGIYIPIKQSDHIFPLMQYTGLKDKNGTEIYEGDIISGTSHFPSGHKLSTNKEVYFEAGGFHVSVNEKNHPGLLLCVFFQREIVGNIYETPELLEAK